MDDDGEKMLHCAGCGVKEDNDIKLKKCACHLVRYCSVKCQKDHRPQHKKACKKRVAELRDEILFKQPESGHYGDCPICCLPLSLNRHTISTSCCGKRICDGCLFANERREECPSCRNPMPKSEEESNINLLKRVEANDPDAMLQMGCSYASIRDYKTAFKYWEKAAKLGDMDAHFNLSLMYLRGQGVKQDEKKQVYHLEEAAIGGHAQARNYLGIIEGKNGRFFRANKHTIIAANMGHDESLEALNDIYAAGLVTKDDFDAALRAHRAAVNATKSPQRAEADEVLQRKKDSKERKSELSDEILFKQPESSHMGDCPICCLPLPLEDRDSTIFTCCGKIVCAGCIHANGERQLEQRIQPNCPFCRHPAPYSVEEDHRLTMKRVEANDPVALSKMGSNHSMKGDHVSAFECFTKAAAFGHAQAHYQLSCSYWAGEGVEKDEKKYLYHAEQAAIGGHAGARHNLGCFEESHGRKERAIKHYIIAAKMGDDKSLDVVKDYFKYRLVSEEDLAMTLHAHQAATEAMKSPQREEAAEYVEAAKKTEAALLGGV